MLFLDQVGIGLTVKVSSAFVVLDVPWASVGFLQYDVRDEAQGHHPSSDVSFRRDIQATPPPLFKLAKQPGTQMHQWVSG